MKLLILNGPNLNLIGQREPEVYGSGTLADLELELSEAYPDLSLQFYQSNYEGTLIDRLHRAGRELIDGVVLNPGGYSHTSVALRDAISAIDVPVIEVHLSNIHARESFRHTSLTAGACTGQISGLGFMSYHLAVLFFVRQNERRTTNDERR